VTPAVDQRLGRGRARGMVDDGRLVERTASGTVLESIPAASADRTSGVADEPVSAVVVGDVTRVYRAEGRGS
jgi:hypothetical protein